MSATEWQRRVDGASAIMMSAESANQREWPLLALPGLLGVALYWPTTGYGFVFDDLSLISEDGPIRHGTTWLAYRPLRHVSYLLDHRVGGGAAWAYHLSNLALHATNAMLVSALALRLGAGIVAAVLGGMLFASHPLGVEAAAYVAGRRDLLALMFSLLAVLAWLSARERPRWAVVALVGAVAAALAKESGLAAIALCATASACGLGPRLVPMLLPLVSALAISLAAVVLYGAVGPLWVSTDPASAIRVAGALSAHYAASTFVPVNLGIDYPHLVCTGSHCDNLAGAGARFGIAVLVGLVAIAAVTMRRIGGAGAEARALAFSGVASVLLFAAICVSIGGHEPGADRHAYPLLAFGSVTLALIFALMAERLDSDVVRRVAVVLGLLLIVVGFRLSEARMSVWRSPWSLWGSAVAQSQVSARSHHNMGRLLASEGHYRHARKHFRSALAADRDFSAAMIAMAAIECERGHYRRAIHAFDRARELGADGHELVRVQRACDVQRAAT